VFLRKALFKHLFGAGLLLLHFYRESSCRRDDIEGMEDIFYSGFKEYARLLQAGARGQSLSLLHI
ncbi:hypothetical protein ACQ4LF_23355, partial [Aeromonas salmonicida]